VEQGKGETAGEPGALQTAVRRARAEQAERSDVTAELRGAGFFTALLFVIELLGSIVLFVLLAGAAYLAWRAGEAWWVSQFSKMT